MKRTVLFLLLTAFYLSAALVPLDKAKKVAENYYAHYCADAASKGSAVINVQENKYGEIITRYTFEFDKGFVIVTADDELYPILGYSDHGKVPKTDQNGGHNFREWFDNYDRQIACKGSGKYIDDEAVKLWKDIENNVFTAGKAGIIVDRLVKSQWGQLYPWNLLCPEKDSMETYAGCVATAMAQILRYHRWPDVGVGSASYDWNGQTLYADFSTHTWNYDLMPEVLDIEYGIYPEFWETGVTQAEKDELSLLSYWTGLSVDMSYGTLVDNGSWAYAAPVDDAFLDHWKASSSVYYAMATPPAGGVDAQFATIKAELDAKRPWFWAGGVHAFLLDGYRDDYWYHFNWGWEGNYDGWFHRSYLIPGGVGSCDTGGGDFTEGQLGITYVPSENPYELWPSTILSGILENGDDISLSWLPNYNHAGFKLYRTRDKQDIPELICETSDLEYTDNDLAEGEYSYYVVTVYLDGESHNSNSYSVEISENDTYPVIKSLSVEPAGRTSIDMSWIKPFTGTLYQYVDFDYWMIPAGWEDKTSRSLTGQSCWTDDPDDWVFADYEDNYSHWSDQYLLDDGFLLMSASATQTLWLLSPAITFKDDSYISWWNRFRYSDDEGNLVAQRPYFEVVSYTGVFDEVGRETDIIFTQHAVYDGNVKPENIWQYEEKVSLASLGGTTARVGFRVPVNENDLYTLAFDRITIGAETSETIEQCTGYEIYRNGSLVKTISGDTIIDWSDPFFEDGVNEYYIKALYPTGVSLPCDRVSVTVDKNPKPDYLTVDYQYYKADLSWYWPYHNPPKWYSYIMPEQCSSVTYLDDTELVKRRTLFKAEDLGCYYPITIDSIAAVFYDTGGGDWGGQNTFKFRILIGGDGSIDSTIYESPTLTAEHKKITKHRLTTPIVLDVPFNLEMECISGTSNPTTLLGKANGSTHSYFLYDNGYGESYYYYMVDPETREPYEWCHMAYITSSMPEPLAKSGGWVRSNEDVDKAVAYPVRGMKKIDQAVKSPVMLDHFNIYRNGISVGTSTWLNYEDYTPFGLDYLKYKVTAVYASPTGESDPSNEVVVFDTGIGNEALPKLTTLYQNYPNPFNPETSIKYSLAADAEVKLTVFDISGRAVTELVSGRQGKGIYSVNFNAEYLSSGIYFYRLSLDEKTVHSNKMMLLK